MPYPGINDPESISKMDSCVEKLMAQGHDKSSAIAICETSIMGKESKMSDAAEFKASDKPGDYLIVEDRTKPTTWHLQVKKDGAPDHGLMGSAWAALHEGYRGNKYAGPDKDKAISKLTALYNAEKMAVPGSKSFQDRIARGEALTATIKQFDPDYAQSESWDVQSASAALSQLAQLAGGEAEQQEPDHVAMLAKIMTALTKFINEEIAEMTSGEEKPAIEAAEMEPTMLEVKPTLADRLKAIFKAGARHNKSDQEMVQTIHDHAAALGADCAMNVKEVNGVWRWTLLTSNAYRDRDHEIVSQKALEADCARADADGYYGPLRWWHVGEYDVATKQAGPGADIGTCDFNAMHDRILIESGTFKNETIARAVLKAAPDLEASLGFFHPITEPDGDGTYLSIRRFERSLLPKGKAANPLTALTVITKETQAMKKEKLQALQALLGETEAANVVKQAEVVQKAADEAGLAFKAKQIEAPVEPEPTETAEDNVAALKELTDTLAASLAPVIEAKIKEHITTVIAAYAQTVEQKAAGQKAEVETALKQHAESIGKLDTTLKQLMGELPRGVVRGVRASESETTIVKDAKTKEFDPKPDPALKQFSDWLTGSAVNA